MFSEYASRFLAQSQSRISNFVQPADNDASPGVQSERYRRTSQPFRNISRGYPLRQGGLYPLSSNRPDFNFTSLYSTAPDAPLFHSALDDFREENDEEEMERETADFYALQKSRRVFASTRLEESTETQPEASNASISSSKNEDNEFLGDRRQARGIKSSWTGAVLDSKESSSQKGVRKEPVHCLAESVQTTDSDGREMEEIGLGSNVNVGGNDTSGEFNFPVSTNQRPPAFQNFCSTPKYASVKLPTSSYPETSAAGIGRTSSPIDTVSATISTPLSEAPSHDLFWGSLYLICFGGMFATFFLIFLHTEAPQKSLGDTIYTTLHSSIYLFAVDTVVSIFVSLIWLALLKSYVRPLVYLIVTAVPTILFSFTLYPFIESFKDTSVRLSMQDQALRWFSFIPAAIACIWVYTIYMGRHSLNKAIGILEFSSKILAANPGLLVMGFGIVGAVVGWTWIWLVMFARVFLGGQLSSAFTKFVIDATSWWLGAYFILMYIWTLSVISGIQRSTTAATVSQWYFHRNLQPAASSKEMVTAAFTHATTTLFGTISLSTLLALLIRLPLLVLPRRITGIVTIVAYSWIPTPISALTNPLTLTYAAIHSQPLQASARGLGQISLLALQAPQTSRRSFNPRNNHEIPLVPYRLARLLLYATRFIMATALGFGGWVATARKLSITLPEGSSIRGSAYAYVVGLVAGFIGWGILGAMEGVLGGILDASIVCWGSERGMGGGRRSYCLEAEYLFGEGREREFA